MASTKAAWGIEVGSDGIKAIRLEREGGRVVVSDFAVIPHKKVLTTPDLDQDEMVRLSLGQLISQKSLEGEHMVMSVPGHAAFARFAKLPPVEPKKVPDIVKFEAVQQIPFPIDEVEWDYQTFTTDDSPEVEVGIFAITRERVQQRLRLYGELGISPESLTLSPVALYNAMAHDLDLTQNRKPVVFLDIGTQATDVIIADEGRCWIRTFPLGGTHFTEAIASAFKLSYTKAEKLKREASTSKYAKQIMQAMRPVFSDLLQDLQRSIGYYQSLHRENDLETMVGIGSTFKIPGLRKFIGQQLQINVVRLDEYKKITVTGREASSFAEHAVNLATAYGLALQGVGLAAIDANLVPVKALREQMWHAKTKWFAAAAAIIVLGAATSLYHPLKDRGRLDPTSPAVVQEVLNRGERLRDEFNEAKNTASIGFRAENMRRLTDYRRVWPHLVHDVAQALGSTNPQAALLGPDVEQINAVKPEERRLVSLRRLDGFYNGEGATEDDGRIIDVTMEVEFSNAGGIAFLNSTVGQWLRDNVDPSGDRADVPYKILATPELDTLSLNPESLTTIKIDADGTEEVKSGAPSGRSDRDRERTRAPAEDRRRGSGAPKRGAPGGGVAGGGGGGGGFGFGGGGGGDDRRKGPTQKRGAPGAGMGSGGAGTGGMGFGTGGGTRRGDRTGSSRTGGTGAPEPSRKAGAIDAEAPLPPRPNLYKGGATIYRVPITFSIEIINPKSTKPAPEKTASARTGRSGA